MLENNNVSQTEFWDRKRGKIVSKKGMWRGGEDVIFSGYSLKKDLLGKTSYMQVVILNATGRLVEKRIADWFEGNFIGMSYPDSRVWCNQIGAYAGQSRATVIAGTVAGVLCADSRAFGSQTNVTGMQFISQALKLHQQQYTIESIVKTLALYKNEKPIIVGYARPVAKQDERIQPHEEMRRQLGFALGDHLKLAFEIGHFLEEKYSLGLNISGYVSAFLCDQGFTPEEVYRIKAISVASGITASHTEGNENSEYSYLPLKCSDTEYSGPENRKVQKEKI